MKKDARARNKGRVSEGSFIRLTHHLLRSAAFRGLTANAVKAFISIAAEYTGKNNGNLAIQRKRMTELGFGASGITFKASVDELIAKGFVILTRPGSVGSGMSRYAITTEPIDASDWHSHPPERTASHAWKKACTESVQGQALNQCNARRKTARPCTEPVLREAENAAPPCTDPVQVYKLPSEADVTGLVDSELSKRKKGEVS